jgi:hypothetical protein
MAPELREAPLHNSKRETGVYSDYSLFGAFERSSIMCDYSLYEFSNRLAREGEELVTYRFPSGSIGLASPVELENAQSKASAQEKPSGPSWAAATNHFELLQYCPGDRPGVCAVCVPPGAYLILKDISAQMQKDLDLRPEEGGKFIETSIEVLRHRDAIKLANGRVIPLQHLCEGQRVEVLSLVPAGEFVERAAEGRDYGDVLMPGLLQPG